MRSKNYWAQLLTYQHNHQKRSRKMDAVIKRNDVVRVNNILWTAKVDVDNFINYLRKILPEDKRGKSHP
jgi:selenocysteine lyase/cysteine desulfurase